MLFDAEDLLMPEDWTLTVTPRAELGAGPRRRDHHRQVERRGFGGAEVQW